MLLTAPKKLLPFIAALRALHVQEQDDRTNLKNVSAILKRWIGRSDWLEDKYYEVDTKVGFSSWLVHEEEDHTLAVNLVAWESGREIVPHDHKTWGVVGSVIGVEKNFLWKRIDDHSAPDYVEIVKEKAAVIRQAGEVVCFLPDDIHSVINESGEVAISLHVYGKNLNYTHRYQYDPVGKSRKPFIVNYS